MKRLLYIVFTLLITASVHAATEAITLNFSDGTSSMLLLSEKPSITFVGQTITISTTSATTTVERSMLKGFSRSTIDAIESLQQLSNAIKMEGKDLFWIEGKSTVTVASIDGKNVSTACTSVTEAGTEVNLSHLPNGIYVISFNKGQTIKYNKR